MHCNLRPPEPRQFSSALITTPCQVWSRWTYPLPYYSVFAHDTLLYAVTLTFDLWPWTLTVYRLTWRDETMFKIWTQSVNPRRSYCDFSIWFYDLERCVTWQISCCARLWYNFHQVLPSTTYPCLNYGLFWCWYVVSRWPSLIFETALTLEVRGTSSVTWSKSVRNLSEIERSAAELLMISRFFFHVHVRYMSSSVRLSSVCL